MRGLPHMLAQTVLGCWLPRRADECHAPRHALAAQREGAQRIKQGSGGNGRSVGSGQGVGSGPRKGYS